MLTRKLNFCASTRTSVASPVSPTHVRSFILNVFCISHPIVWLRMPYRRSDAIATQFFPAIAMTAEPLYCIIDDMRALDRGPGAAGAAGAGRVRRGGRAARLGDAWRGPLLPAGRPLLGSRSRTEFLRVLHAIQPPLQVAEHEVLRHRRLRRGGLDREGVLPPLPAQT